MKYNPYETICSDELIPADYDDYIEYFDSFRQERVETMAENSPTNECSKCGELVSDFEISLNFGRCTYCNYLVDVPL